MKRPPLSFVVTTMLDSGAGARPAACTIASVGRGRPRARRPEPDRTNRVAPATALDGRRNHREPDTCYAAPSRGSSSARG